MPTAAGPRTLRTYVVVTRHDLCVEFVNTLAWRGSTPTESLQNFADVRAWLSSSNALPPAAVADLRRWSDKHPTHAAAVFDQMIEIREVLHRMLHGVASSLAGERTPRVSTAAKPRSLALLQDSAKRTQVLPPPSKNARSDDLRRFNRALDDAVPRALLDRADGGFGWRIELKPGAAAILAPVLWSAADILVCPTSARLRECANDRCLWLFIDDSKNGTRRWCSMQSCGNRAKAHRHYLRRRDN